VIILKFYRIKQFNKAILAKVSEKDKTYVSKILNKDESLLFYKQSRSEQKHCIEVAIDITQECKRRRGINIKRLQKAALLHDVGKITKPLRIYEKSILVILDRLSKGKLKKFTNIKKIDVYYNHGYNGYVMLKDIEKDKDLLKLVLNHHDVKDFDKEPKEINEELLLLNICDERN
jgi:putative nucleotidyltransferase with HDIG domain